MKKLQISSFTFFVAVTAVSLVLYGSNATADSCQSSCQSDCRTFQGAERTSCQLQCLAGRCENPGAQQVAQVTGEPGIDCSVDGVCNSFCPAGQDPDCFSFPPGHIGYSVEILLDGNVQNFTAAELQFTAAALATQDPSGAVLLSVLPCTSSGCFRSAAVRALRPVLFPVGTTVNYRIVSSDGLPAGNTTAHCRLDRLPSFSTIAGSFVDLSSPSVGNNFFSLTAAEPDGIVLHCEVNSEIRF